MQDYGNDVKNLTYALQDLLHAIQQQAPGVVKFTPTGTDYMETYAYKNAVETHKYYLERMS